MDGQPSPALVVGAVDASHRGWFVAWRDGGKGGEREGGRAGSGSVHTYTEVCCPLRSLQHMAKALTLTGETEKK